MQRIEIVLVFKDERVCGALLALALALGGEAFAQTAQPGRYAIDSDRSSLHWRVYKAGAFARFGHNHVISVPAPTGSIDLASPIEDSRFELVLPVTELVIDDPQLRSAYGEEFSSEPTAEDIDGTRRNMLGEMVLDGANFPIVRVTGSGLDSVSGGQTIKLDISILGRVVSVDVPVDVSVGEHEINAKGDFRLTHADLEMEPFSVMMGALQVADEIDFSFEIHATRED